MINEMKSLTVVSATQGSHQTFQSLEHVLSVHPSVATQNDVYYRMIQL